MKEPNFPIDFVVSWVDGSDPKWLRKKSKYQSNLVVDRHDPFNSSIRYREYGLFKFWFRSVEKNAPWVRNIYLVTDNQIPDFLNLNNSKIIIVDHMDIIDHKYLPTFDSNTIELNIFKIKGLSNHFVYFNDDFYINNPVVKSDFFTEDGFSRDTIGQSIIMPIESYDHNIVNNTIKVNQIIKKKKLLMNQAKNFFSLNQGFEVFLLNIMLAVFPRFTRLFDPHTAYSINKSDMSDAIDVLGEELSKAFSKPFRSLDDYTIQFIRYFQILKNHSRPRKKGFGETADSNNVRHIQNILFKKRHVKIINVNDNETASEKDLKNITNLFEKKFPNKSSFEK